MKILFIAHRLPYPPDKGDKIRSFNIVKELSKRNEIFLACPIDNSIDLTRISALYPYVKDVLTQKISPVFQKLLGLFLSFGGRPISVTYFYSRSLQKKIDHLIRSTCIDVIFCYSSPSAEYLFRSRHAQDKLQQAVWIMDFIDVDSQKWEQYAASSKWPMRWIYKNEAIHLRAYEKRITEKFDHTLLVSPSEKRILEESIPGAAALPIRNGVDLDFFKPVHTADISGCRDMKIVFTGLMNYRPNIEAVIWFAESVFPLIQCVIPEATFCIVGNHPTAQVKRLERISGISVTGYVPDIRKYIAAAAVCVVPLKIARGIQNKVLEAMAMGKAVVCTSQALEGIDATPGEQVIVADTAESFARETEALIRDTLRNQKIGLAARCFVEEHFSWPGNLTRLEQLFTMRKQRVTEHHS